MNASSVVSASLPLLVVIGIPLWAVVLTAIWARSPERRKDARRVLRIVTRRAPSDDENQQLRDGHD